MKTILISTIVRNRAKTLHKWHSQIKDLVSKDKKNKYYLSVYENDSTDDSKDILKSLDFSFFEDFYLGIEDIKTKYYGSVLSTDGDRTSNLATARNKTIFAKDFLKKCTHVLSIEPEVTYNTSIVLEKIINTNHDIISGISKAPPKEGNHNFPYDSWATRKNLYDHGWYITNELEGKMDVWTTYNCLCLYDAKPLNAGVCFGSYNLRLKKFDCDTAVICENFRAVGFNDIKIDVDVVVKHDC
tara:strand:- start:3179 stop:3904 length:726 start_codon:yes stop_codon:yes gene_type:complete